MGSKGDSHSKVYGIWGYREGVSDIVHDRAFWMIQMVDCGRLRESVVSKRGFGWWGGGEQKI